MITGHFLAVGLHNRYAHAWVVTAMFYAVWLSVSIYFFTDKNELRNLFRPSVNTVWVLLPFLLVIPVFIFVFLPNKDLLKPDGFLVLQVLLCLINPFLEEIYWRGILGRISDSPAASFFYSTTFFAASHPLIFGVNSPGASGWIGFLATFIAGAAFWMAFHKTKSLRSAVLAHFFIDVAGMAVYVLADRIKLVSFDRII